MVLMLILLSLSAFFSGTETALLSVNKVRILRLVEEGNKRAQAVQKMLDAPSRLIATILIGNNIVNIGASALATSIAIDIYGNAGVGIATGIMTLLVLVFG
jgi:putative hemolysin